MSLFQKLSEYGDNNYIRMHMPGHKGKDPFIKDTAKCMDPIYKMDITEIPGFDDLHNANGEIRDIEKRLANYYGVPRAKILVNGSTAGIIAGILSLTKEGDKILLSRCSHKSVYNAIILGKLNPVFLNTNTDKYGIPMPINAEEIEDVLARNPDIKLGILTNPTYEGVFCNIKDIKDVFLKRGIPLLTDGAHGACIRDNTISDIEIKSLHKTLPFFTQTSCMLINSGVEGLMGRIEFYLSCFQSSSPSYILMAGIDRGLRFMEERGRKAEMNLKDNLAWFYERTSKLRDLKVIGYENRDPSKIIITSKSGPRAVERLYNTFLREKIIPEMQGICYILLMASVMNTREDFESIINVLFEEDKIIMEQSGRREDYPEIRNGAAKSPEDSGHSFCIPPGQFKVPMHEAFEIGFNNIELRDGAVSTGFVEFYPPGIPIICPGEVITKAQIALVKKAKELNINVRGIS